MRLRSQLPTGLAIQRILRGIPYSRERRMCAPRAPAASAPATAQPLSFPAHRRNPAPIAFPSSGGRIRSPLIYPAPPLSWYRLAILSHAGVLTTALRGVQKTNNFFKWSARDFGSNYLWHTAVDTHE